MAEGVRLGVKRARDSESGSGGEVVVESMGHGRFGTWEIERADAIRRVHRLAISSLGPPLSRSNLLSRCGTLPVYLRPEEVCLGSDEGFLRLEEGGKSVGAPLLGQEETLRYIVMRKLWNQGCFMTPGLKFGGDLLAYPDDPSRTHGPFLVVVLPFSQGRLHPLPVLALSRVANASLKVLVYALVRIHEDKEGEEDKEEEEEEDEEEGEEDKEGEEEEEDEEDGRREESGVGDGVVGGSEEKKKKVGSRSASDAAFQRASVTFVMFTRKFPKVKTLSGVSLRKSDVAMVEAARQLLESTGEKVEVRDEESGGGGGEGQG